MHFYSDNLAHVHPKVWEVMRAADVADMPYDNDALSARLDEAFSTVFARECLVLWTTTGTAANCLARTGIFDPHGGAVHPASSCTAQSCFRQAER